MPFDPDDPRLTAYALGELEPDERAEFAAALAEDAEARRLVDEIRATADLLTIHLAREQGPALAPAQHQAIEHRLRRPSPWKIALALGGLAMAAGLLLAVGLYAGRPQPTEDFVVAMAKTPPAPGGRLHNEAAPSADTAEALGESARDWRFATPPKAAPPAAPASPSSTPPPLGMAPPPPQEEYFRRDAGQNGRGRAAEPAENPPHYAYNHDGTSVALAPMAPGTPPVLGPQPPATVFSTAPAQPGTPAAPQAGAAMMAPAGGPAPAGGLRGAGGAMGGMGAMGGKGQGIANGKAVMQGFAAGRLDQRGEAEQAPPEAPPAPAGAVAAAADRDHTLALRAPARSAGGEDLAYRSKKESQAKPGLKALDEAQKSAPGTEARFATKAGAFATKAGATPLVVRSVQEDLASDGAKDSDALLARRRGLADRQAPQLAEKLANQAQAGQKPAGESLGRQNFGIQNQTARPQGRRHFGMPQDQKGDQQGQNLAVGARKPQPGAEQEVALAEGLEQKQKGVAGLQLESKPPADQAAKNAPDRFGRPDRFAIDAFNAPEAAQAAEDFGQTVDNPWVVADQDQFSTFAIDVDTASYANVRRYLRQGGRPPRDAVRIEEMINYFRYDYPEPEGDDPFSVNVEVARCPWDGDHRLVRVGLRGKDIDLARRPASNLVFLLDVSGSMDQPNKLPLVKDAMRMLVDRLGENDRVAVVVYAGAEGLALPSTHGDRRGELLSAIDQLQAGGSTNGGAGINLAYRVAEENFIKGGTNRVILCTDGDFNVGVTSDKELEDLIEQKRKTGVFLSVLGFGEGNLKDKKMEGLADKGDGNYAYIDTAQEARKVLVEEMGATLVAIAKDVKIQVEFNPNLVERFRLIGYANRVMKHEDFRDDRKDAGEIGAGHTVTAFYEVIPAARPEPRAELAREGVRYRKLRAEVARGPVEEKKGDPNASELLTVRLRYKKPTDGEDDAAKEIERNVADEGKDYAAASPDFKFAAAVAEFGMILRDTPTRPFPDLGNASLAGVLELAEASLGKEPPSYRREFLELVKQAQAIGARAGFGR